MTDIASRFLLANLAAAVAVLLVLVLRKPARRLFGARLAYVLWLPVPLAGFASLLPRVVEVVIPAPLMESVREEATLLLPSAVETALAADPLLLQPQPATAPTPIDPPIAPRIDPWALGWLAWLAGAIAMAAWLAYGQSRFLSDARKGKAGPAVVGVLRPRIVVPADFEERFEPKERDVILAHERIHLARHDAHINALLALARCACWFNPMIHLAAHLARIDQELACDATVAERHPKAKAVYASALLKAQLAMRPLPLGCYWPAGTEHPLTERIEMLKQVAPGRVSRFAGVGALGLLSVSAGLGAWAAMPAETHLIEAPQDQRVPALPPETARQTEYRLGAGDRVRIGVFDQPELSGVFHVDVLGAITMPLIGQVEVKGLVLTEVEQRIQTELKEWLREPRVSAEIAEGAAPPLPPTFQPPVSGNGKAEPVRYQRQTLSPIARGAGAYQPVFVRGKVEKITFGDSTYVIQLRASSIGRDTSSSPLPNPWGENVNTAQWELSPTNYFGERDSIEKDLLGREVLVRGATTSDLSCASGCRIKVRELVVPKSTAVPAPGNRPFGISDFAMYYDTTKAMIMSGKVQRLEFADETFDAWIQTKGHGVEPGVLYQIRSEYFLPRADIEARLRNQDIIASGWPARGDDHGFCSPVCGMYAEMMWLENGTPLSPGSNRPISPPPNTPEPQPSAPGLVQNPRLSLNASPWSLVDQPIEIKADTGRYSPEEGRGVYVGNAQMTQGDSRMTTDMLTAVCQRNASQACEGLRTLIAEGSVAYTSPDISIRSNRAEYDYQTAAITFTGDVVSKRGDEGVLRGAAAVYNIREKRIRISAGGVTSTLTSN